MEGWRETRCPETVGAGESVRLGRKRVGVRAGISGCTHPSTSPACFPACLPGWAVARKLPKLGDPCPVIQLLYMRTAQFNGTHSMTIVERNLFITERMCLLLASPFQCSSA